MLAELSMARARVSGSSPAFSKAEISCGWPSWRTRKTFLSGVGAALLQLSEEEDDAKLEEKISQLYASGWAFPRPKR